MTPKSILKKTSSSARPTPGGRTASGKRIRPGQNHRKAAAGIKESEAKQATGKGKGRFDKPKPSGKYEKYTGPGEYTGPTGGNAGPLGKGVKGKSDVKGKQGDGKGRKRVTMAVRKEVQGGDDEDVDMSDDENDFGGSDAGDDNGSDGAGTDEEIERAKGSGSKSSSNANTSKFGDTLTSLLAESSLPSSSTPTTSTTAKAKKAGAQQPILSLSKAKLPPSRSALALERRAEEAVKKAKIERVERARVTDVMEGWAQPGGSQEFERGLRKVAQRGVIKLFNAILSASKVNDESQSLADQVGLKDEKTRRKEKDNILGRGGKEVLTKENFLDMVRKG